jgi:FtsP/CotA-like multicopper oxidase with cupredoxin domain
MRCLSRCIAATLFLLFVPSAALAQTPANSELLRAAANDNRTPAGHVSAGVLVLRLELRPAAWYPEEENGGHLPVFAFAEEGRAPQIPGPLIRVARGTQLHLHVRNSLPLSAKIYGLHGHPGDPQQSVVLAPGESCDLQFAAGEPGTYFYWATTSGKSVEKRDQEETLLSGAFIVDPPGARLDDRIFVINIWTKGDPTVDGVELPAFNGKGWPNSEHLTYHVGDTLHWRVINPTFSAHAMHLHGFYFTVDAVGDNEHYTRYTPDQRRMVVTEKIEFGHTFDMTWTPDRTGNWLFHCHMVAHMTPPPDVHPDSAAPQATPPAAPPAVQPPVQPVGHQVEMESAPGPSGGMGSLILGLTILPAPNSANHSAPANASTTPPHKLQLVVSDNLGKLPLYSLRVVDPANPPPPSAPAIPGFPDPNAPLIGPPIILTRGEPAEIEVKNDSSHPTSIHWHGIELESYYDGVAGWTGTSDRPSPPVHAGTSFIARMTPPRAGTFIYHTHWHDADQLLNGLYGPLIVLEPGQKFDPAHDLIFVFGDGDFHAFGFLFLINGNPQPFPMFLHAGTRYRLRFINIMDNVVSLRVRLVSNDSLLQWKVVAKDGAALPPSQIKISTAELPITVGDTYDVEYQAASPGDARLEIWDPGFPSREVQPLVFSASQ